MIEFGFFFRTNRFIIARSSVKRNTRGFSLPGCGLGVIVPEDNINA